MRRVGRSHPAEIRSAGILWPCLSEDAYEATGLASHILRTEFGSTPATFVDSLREANAAIQSDIFHWGEDGFIGNIYRPPAPTERPCPWCAETIKAAAVVCRFCGRQTTDQAV